MKKWDKLASEKTIEETRKNIADMGVNVLVVNSRNEALEKIKSLIPSGAEVMNGSSTTLDEIGFVEHLNSGKHGWRNLHDEISKEKDMAKFLMVAPVLSKA